ncbi:MAG: hypothetical protein ACREOW_17225 [Thermodesulfobacteriota bacterium]
MKKAGNPEAIKKSAKPWSRFAVTLTFVLLAIMAVLIADPVSAFKIKAINGPVDPEGTLSNDGLQVTVSGTFNCDTTETGKPGDSWEVEVSVVQLSTLTEALDNT